MTSEDALGGAPAHRLLHLIVPIQAEDALVEWLLERADVPGFTSSIVYGHGSSERSMTIAEQVAGRSRRVLFVLLLPGQIARQVLRDLGKDFRDSGIHSWTLPALEHGRLA
jgi:hypothetical protein